MKRGEEPCRSMGRMRAHHSAEGEGDVHDYGITEAGHPHREVGQEDDHEAGHVLRREATHLPLKALREGAPQREFESFRRTPGHGNRTEDGVKVVDDPARARPFASSPAPSLRGRPQRKKTEGVFGGALWVGAVSKKFKGLRGVGADPSFLSSAGWGYLGNVCTAC